MYCRQRLQLIRTWPKLCRLRVLCRVTLAVRLTVRVPSGLLDLGLLAQGDVLVGSLYSNYARLGMQLGSAARHGFRHMSFDALWCPYHTCQAGCTDVERLCHNPSFLVETELNAGQRGRVDAESGIQLRSVAGDEATLENLTHPARRPWVNLLLDLRRRLGGTPLGNANSSERERRRSICRNLFDQAAPALRWMPRVY